MVSTPGFLPGNPSSNLGSFTSMNRFGCTRDGKIRQNNHIPVAQLVERRFPKPKVPGSSPGWFA